MGFICEQLKILKIYIFNKNNYIIVTPMQREKNQIMFLTIVVTLKAFGEIKSSIACSIAVFLAMLCAIKVGGALVPRCCMWCRIACGVGLRYNTIDTYNIFLFLRSRSRRGETDTDDFSPQR